MLLAQCGYGKGEKVQKGLRDGSVTGVILSPRDEPQERLVKFSRQIRDEFKNALILFDPQFYAATLRQPNDGKLSEYPYYSDNTSLSRTQFGARRISKYAKQCLDFQHSKLGTVNYLISPSVVFEDFQDSWSQIALDMAEASLDYHSKLSGAAPLLVTVAVSESAFRNSVAINEFLDALSTLDVSGFYLLVSKNSRTYQLAVDSESMGWQMYFTHVLGIVNEYELIVGYRDWLGLLLAAASKARVAFGWHQSLRQFSLHRYQPSTGGKRPRRRYSCAPLLSNPLIVPELEDIHLAGQLKSVLTGTEYDRKLAQGPAAGEGEWTDEVSCLAHWASVARTLQAIEGKESVSDRLAELQGHIARAEGQYTRLSGLGVTFDYQTGPSHLSTWSDAIERFQLELR